MVNAFVKWLLAALLLLPLLPSRAQQGSMAVANKKIKLQSISIDDGLSQGYVSRVLQDKTGYLWIATADGLNRYDGYEFVVYRNSPDNHSIASNYVKKMCLDRAGRLWITFAQGGLDLFDRDSGTFIHVIPIGSRPITTDPDGFSFLGQYRNGVAFIRNRQLFGVSLEPVINGAKKGKPASASTRIQPLSAAKNSAKPTWGIMPDIYTSANGQTWLLDVNSSLYQLRIDTTANRYQFVEHSLPVALVPANTPKVCRHFFAVDEFRGLIYFQQYNNLYKLDPKTGDTDLLMQHTGFWTFLFSAVDQNGNIWFANYGKLYFLDTAARKGWFVESADRDIEKKNVSTDGACYLDNTGNIWVSTLGYGLTKINLRNASFHHVKRERAINFSSKKIYTSVRGDLRVTPWEGEDCLFDTIQKKLVPGEMQFTDKGPMKNGRLIPLYPFTPGSTKIPADILQHGNYHLRPMHNSYICLIEPDRNFATVLYKEAQTVYECPYLLAPGHKVWFVAENKSLHSLDLASGRYVHMPLPTQAGLARETIARDRNGDIWLAVENGIAVYQAATGKWRTYLHHQQGGLQPGSILCFFFATDDPEHAWIGFEGKGFCKMNIKTGACRYCTTENGLPNNVVYGIMQDKSGSLWMSTNSGLSSYNIRSNQFRNYTFEDGLQSNEFNRYCFAQSPAGAMLFGGVNGVNYFKAAEITSRKTDTRVWLTDMFVNNKTIGPSAGAPVARDQELDLAYNQNMIAFRFALSDLTNPKQNQFTCKLEGIDEEWSRMSTEHNAVYTYLPPGDYTFRVKGFNRDGVGAGNEIRFPFSIATPWWQTWWFRTWLVLVVGATMYALYRYRLNQVLRLQAMRNRISADMHDEIGSTLSSISFYSQALLMQNPDDAQRSVLEKIKSNAQDVQDGLSDIVWSVKADMDSFESLLIRMQRVGNELFEPKNIRFHFDADPKLKHLNIDMMTRKNCYLIFKEALHNAAKYAQCRNVWIDIQTSRQQVVMTIRDDGRGFDTTTQSNGNGLGNMQQRAASIKGDLRILSSPGNGTELTLSIKTPAQ
ncbi:Two component regulator propeller [Dyadobacter soli]|uniref:Two component regulator propeller n=1 Tax=Dyadobacter soli TaxID=659014 RepID=A0A1G7FV65_9BACT|nr:two-component regulator propeller domain-containing protein [Dyadobacter soli]SDE79761.1 Two component regulator propeller [Dyadobacter soli]